MIAMVGLKILVDQSGLEFTQIHMPLSREC